MTAVVLLSGGMDSAVALYWAAKTFHTIYGLFFDYHQIAFDAELIAASRLWGRCGAEYKNLCGELRIAQISPSSEIFIAKSSITGGAEVNQYANVEEAVAKTSTDKAYLPLRNGVFTTIAAHHLLVHSPEGGYVILGTRARPDGSGGYPDCTLQFAMVMTDALSLAAGKPINVLSPLNQFAPSRAKTIRLAQKLPGCFEALEVTTSCFKGTKCEQCLPCLRRAQAFQELGLKDPAL